MTLLILSLHWWLLWQGFLDFALEVILRHCPVFLPKIVPCSTTACEKVNLKRQMSDLSENEKICQRKCNIPVQTGYFQSVFAEAQLGRTETSDLIYSKCWLLKLFIVTALYSMVNQALNWWTLCFEVMQWEMQFAGIFTLNFLNAILLWSCAWDFSVDPSSLHFSVLKEC